MKKTLALILTCVQAFAGSVGADNNAFGTALYKQLQKEEGNLVFSPYSLFTNLSLLMYGAEGKTATEMQKALHIQRTDTRFLTLIKQVNEGLTQDQENGYELKIANGLFPDKGTQITTNYQKLADTSYDAKLQPLDYADTSSAISSINKWISDRTDGKIEKLVTDQDISPSTRLVLANAIYFEGSWLKPFSPRKTDTQPFFPAEGSVESVPTLHQTDYFPYYETKQAQYLFLPFARSGVRQPALQCLLILPKEGKKWEGFNSEEAWEKSQQTLISMQIPKFCFSKRYEMNAPLEALGMKEAFTDSANFSKINGMQDLFLSKVLHEAYFAFEERGVTASAATTSHIGLKSMPPNETTAIPFIADRPFLFMILDSHSHTILFMGRLDNPSETKCNEN